MRDARVCTRCGYPALDSDPSRCPKCGGAYRGVKGQNWMWRRYRWLEKHPGDAPGICLALLHQWYPVVEDALVCPECGTRDSAPTGFRGLRLLCSGGCDRIMEHDGLLEIRRYRFSDVGEVIHVR